MVGIQGTLVPRSLAEAPSLAWMRGVYSRSAIESTAAFSISSCISDRIARYSSGMPRLLKVSASNFSCRRRMFDTGMSALSSA